MAFLRWNYLIDPPSLVIFAGAALTARCGTGIAGGG
jgi:hypothetical protein